MIRRNNVRDSAHQELVDLARRYAESMMRKVSGHSMNIRPIGPVLPLVYAASILAITSSLLGQVPQISDQNVVITGTGDAVTSGTGISGNPGTTGTSAISSLAPGLPLGYHVIAYKPHDSAKVRVDVSLTKQQVYVMEGERCLMAAACCVGLPEKPTPKGHFTITEKVQDKRSGAYGYQVSNDMVTPCLAATCHGTYVGYPMPFWCGFMPAYGFYQGYVWPTPHTHGVIRLDKEVAPRFFELVQTGTPVDIADTQPEDPAVGRNVQRPDDYRDPDPPPTFMIGPGPFKRPAGTLLIDQ